MRCSAIRNYYKYIPITTMLFYKSIDSYPTSAYTPRSPQGTALHTSQIYFRPHLKRPAFSGLEVSIFLCHIDQGLVTENNIRRHTFLTCNFKAEFLKSFKQLVAGRCKCFHTFCFLLRFWLSFPAVCLHL